MRKAGTVLQQAREKTSDYFDDADVLPGEDPDAREDPSEAEWTQPRKIELALPTLAVLTAACVMALFYHATHPYELDPPAEPVAYAPWIESPRAAVVPAAPHPVRTPAAAPVESETAIVQDALPNVAGGWTLATQVESSRYAPYNGLRLGYEVELEQDGDRVSGIGRKILENGDGIVARAQTPIAVNGTVDGDHVMLDFIEHGARRATQGTFVLTRVGDEALRGRFTTTAARSAGSVEARRVINRRLGE